MVFTSDYPKEFLVIMQRKDGNELCKQFDQEPTADDLNQMAKDAGYSDGDVFPPFAQYQCMGGGGGEQSGHVGDKWS